MLEKLNLNLCRAAMMEFEINMAEMPLGKLSKRNVQKGSYHKKNSHCAHDMLLCFSQTICVQKDAKIKCVYFLIIGFCFPGFEALTEIQNLLNNNAHDPSVKESLIIDASNRFFTMIPSIHPHIIRDEDDFKSKVLNQVWSIYCVFAFLPILNPFVNLNYRYITVFSVFVCCL